MLVKFIAVVIILLAAPSGALAVEDANKAPAAPLMERQLKPVKPKFKDNHPKVYRAYRGARFACHVAEPFINVTAKVCQIVLPFII